MKSARLYSLLAASISLSLYGPAVLGNNSLPVLAETKAQSDTDDGLLINKEEIKSVPVANNTLSQLLKTQPGIAINDGTGSVRAGDLAPEEISLANARPHQTNYMIGGVTTNNITTFGADDKAGTLGGHTSGYFFDTQLLESVEVIDRNVSAEYGSFTGGIINAELRKPSDKFETEYQYRMTDSSWNSHPKLDEDNKYLQSPVWGDGRFQDEYQKRFHSLFVGGPVNEQHKIGFGLSVQESDIPLLYKGERKDQVQKNISAFINHLTQLGGWDLSSEIRFSQFNEERFITDPSTSETTDFSDYENSHEGIGFTLKVNREFAQGRWNNTLAFDQLKDDRRSDVNFFKFHADLRDFTFEDSGSYGNLEQIQNSTKLKSSFDLNPLYTGSIRHQPVFGAEATLHSAKGTFNEDFHSFSQTSRASGNLTLTNWTITEAGNYKASTNQYALYASNTSEWNRLTVDLGLRAEKMEQFDKTVFAPRFKTTWDFNTDKRHRIGVGASRYYSSSLLGWALKAEKRRLETNYQRCQGTGSGEDISLNPDDYTCQSSTRRQPYRLNQADIPYSNEFTVNYDVQLSNINISAGYLYREQRKGLSLLNSETLQNNIESDSRIYSLRLSNAESLYLLGANIDSYLALGYLDTTGAGSTGSTYDAQNDLNSEVISEWVELDGKLLRRNEMDTGSYNSDVTTSIGLNAHWQESGVVWNNIFNYEAGRNLTLLEGIANHEIDGTDTRVNTYSSAKMDSLITWDTQLTWVPPIANKQLTLGLTVTNLLDEQVKIATSGTNTNSSRVDDYYSKGREVWLSVGARL